MEEQTSGLKRALDELLKGKKTEEIVGPNGLPKQLTKALLERAMNAELTHRLGYEKGQPEGHGSGNNRNATSRKTVQGDFGSTEIALPRDRNGASSRRFCPSTNAAGRDSTTRLSRCTRVA